MAARIRDYLPADQSAVVDLSLLAWAAPFASINDVLGDELAYRLHGEDWRVYQGRAVRETLADPESTAWVAEEDERCIGFVVATVADPDRLVGQITMLAVDPAHQGQGIGRALVNHSTAWLAKPVCAWRGSGRAATPVTPRPGRSTNRPDTTPCHWSDTSRRSKHDRARRPPGR